MPKWQPAPLLVANILKRPFVISMCDAGRTVQRHREGPDANAEVGAASRRHTHDTERGPGLGATPHTGTITPITSPARTAAGTHPGRTRNKTDGTTRPRSNPGARQTAERATCNPHLDPQPAGRRPDRANYCTVANSLSQKTGAHAASATAAPTKKPSMLLPHRRGQKERGAQRHPLAPRCGPHALSTLSTSTSMRPRGETA